MSTPISTPSSINSAIAASGSRMPKNQGDGHRQQPDIRPVTTEFAPVSNSSSLIANVNSRRNSIDFSNLPVVENITATSTPASFSTDFSLSEISTAPPNFKEIRSESAKMVRKLIYPNQTRTGKSEKQLK